MLVYYYGQILHSYPIDSNKTLTVIVFAYVNSWTVENCLANSEISNSWNF